MILKMKISAFKKVREKWYESNRKKTAQHRKNQEAHKIKYIPYWHRAHEEKMNKFHIHNTCGMHTF